MGLCPICMNLFRGSSRIYTRPLCTSAYFLVRLYADDTSLTASGNDLDKSLSEINDHLNDIFDWLRCNKLTLNLSETKYVFNLGRK